MKENNLKPGLIYWVARDKEGKLYLFNKKPLEGKDYSEDGLRLPSDWYKEVKEEPKKITFI